MAELDEPISERELDVLNYLVEGASNREIADQLSISPNTVKVHLRNIYTKLGVSSRTEAATVALQKGVLSLPGVEVNSAAPDAESDGELSSEQAEVTVPVATAPPSQEQAGYKSSISPPQGSPVIPSVPPVTRFPYAPHTVPAPRPTRPLLQYMLAAIAVIALLLSALAVGRLWGEDAGEVSATPVVDEVAVEAPPTFEEIEIGANWLKGRSLPAPRAHMAVTGVGLNIYVIGGETTEGVSNDVLVYNTQTRIWETEQGAPKITPVADAAAAVLAGEIYVIGGRLPTGQATAIVEAYSPLNDGWRPVASLPRPLVGGVALAQSSALYLFGGSDREQVLDTAYVYEPAAGEWEELPPMQQARTFATGGIINGNLYVVGGTDGEQALNHCEFFDPTAQAWQDCPEMTTPRVGASSGVVLNKLYVIGGTGEDEKAASEVYDANQEQWEQIPTPMLETEPDWPFLGVTNVETRVYALGGRHQDSLSQEMFIYTPLVYQFFIPAAGRGE